MNAKAMYVAITDGENILEDNIICVNRSIRPSYPDWVGTVMHQELEKTGHAKYDISAVEQWLHEKQKNGGRIGGNEKYTYLKDKDMIKDCLGVRDLEEIQKKGVAFFRRHFQDKVVFGWKGIVRNRGGLLLAPCLYGDGCEVVLRWYWLDNDWDGRFPALRFASSAKA